jgi:hypothetical protein
VRSPSVRVVGFAAARETGRLVLRANVALLILLTEYYQLANCSSHLEDKISLSERKPTKPDWRKAMNPTPFAILGLSLFMGPALAQTSPATAVPPATESAAKAAFGVLPGRWVRVQGGYVITINSVDADGRLDASYANPRPLPFHTAVATSDGNSLKLFFELRAAGYNGSTHTLSYDAANDRLTGVYDQVVVKQKFDVVFVRDK